MTIVEAKVHLDAFESFLHFCPSVGRDVVMSPKMVVETREAIGVLLGRLGECERESQEMSDWIQQTRG